MTTPLEVEDAKDEEVKVESDDREFPAPFYDPTTGEVMTDPYVNEAGDSYDKSSLTDNSETFYPNRALQAIIQHEVELADNTWKGSVRRFDFAMHSGWGRLMAKSAFGSDYRPLPDGFYCPITVDLMTDPVIAKDGTSYERAAIERWIQVNGKSPISRTPITIDELRENNALYELIQKEKGRKADSVHPSIRRWRESDVPTSRRPLNERNANGIATSMPPSAPDGPALPTIDVPNHPITEEEIEARRRENARGEACGCCVFILTLMITASLLPVGVTFALLFVASLLCLCSSCKEEQEQEHRDRMNT